jgi:hypothetical protein
LQNDENLEQKNHCLGSLQLILNHKTKNENNNVQVEIRFSCQNMAILCQQKPYFPHHLGYRKLWHTYITHHSIGRDILITQILEGELQ